MSKSQTLENKKINQIVVFLAAVCLFLSTIEYAIPKPLPFMRLGLANLPILIGLTFLPWRKVIFLAFLKIFAQSVISGTLFSYVFLFSAGGSLASVLGMLLAGIVYKKNPKLISLIGVNLIGALANNIVQILLSRFILFGESAKLIAPILLISGIVTGLFLGFFADLFYKQSVWLKKIKLWIYDSDIFSVFPNSNLIDSTDAQTTQTWKVQKKVKFKILPTLIVFMSIVLFNLFVPFGKILFTIGTFKVTEGALLSGIKRGLILCLSIFISKVVVSKNIYIPGRLGRLIDTIFRYFGLLATSDNKQSSYEKKDRSRHNKKSRFFEIKGKFSTVAFIEKIDEKLISAWSSVQGNFVE